MRFTRPVRPDEARRLYLAHLRALDIDPADLTIEAYTADESPPADDDVVLEAPEPEVLPASTYPVPADRRPREAIRAYITEQVNRTLAGGTHDYTEADWTLVDFANAAVEFVDLASRCFHDSAVNEVPKLTAAYAKLRRLAPADADAVAPLVDRILELREALLVPPVGGAATIYGWSDADAYTVIEVRKRGREVVLRQDRSILLNGHASGAPDSLSFSPGGFHGHTSGVQRWRYEADPEGEIVVVSRRDRKDGTVVWKKVGTATGQAGRGASFGRRGTHYDFNF